MIFPGDLRRQARVCARLAEDCEDERLSDSTKEANELLVFLANQLIFTSFLLCRLHEQG
jgi:hypothetical protein